MPNLMPTLSTLIISSVAAISLIAPAAFAQQGDLAPPAPEPVIESIKDLETHFNAADLDGDEALDQTEYASLIDILADNGDSAAIALRETGSYISGFISADTNADGVVTLDELLA